MNDAFWSYPLYLGEPRNINEEIVNVIGRGDETLEGERLPKYFFTAHSYYMKDQPKLNGLDTFFMRIFLDLAMPVDSQE